MAFAAVLIMGADHAVACDDGARFSVKETTALVDRDTGLAWQACLAGQSVNGETCEGDPLHLSWLDADAAAKEMAGNWRLPTLEDLETLMDPSCSDGALPSAFGIDRSRQIWTASPGFPVNDVAAVMDLDTGKIWGVGKGVKRHFFLVSDALR